MELWTFGQYPEATIAHWAQGVIAGFFIARGIAYHRTEFTLTAMCLLILYLAYEISEFADIHDHPSVDIFNFGICAWGGALLGYLVIRYERWKNS